MVVQHNITAMNSNRMLNVTSKSQAKSTEKLSSGYKINRAADDAAGLSISEKMRKQIRGLTQASSNAQDGISAVQTAEGALTEVHDMLQRMNELAVKSANGTNSEDDRNYIQAEVDQLVTEIDRVATTTKFNETYLLKGNGGELKFTKAKANSTIAAAVATNTGGTGVTSWDATGSATVTASAAHSAGTAALTGDTASTYNAATLDGINGKSYILLTDLVVASGKTTTLEDIAKDLNGKRANENQSKYYTSIDEMEADIARDSNQNIKTVNVSKNSDNKLVAELTAFADVNSALSFSLHVGADSTKDNTIGVNVSMMSARGLAINGIRVDGSDGTKATAAIDTIAAAVKTVSSQRSALGAVQNRLEHTINNLDNVVENTTSAESAIRDTDMATEMVSYSNKNILAQAGQAMLAQANQSNQGVLSLLR